MVGPKILLINKKLEKIQRTVVLMKTDQIKSKIRLYRAKVSRSDKIRISNRRLFFYINRKKIVFWKRLFEVYSDFEKQMIRRGNFIFEYSSKA